MPTDDIVKRLNNLLQMRTALESSNVSPQYLSNEVARRDAKKLENKGNSIDPVTKKPFNRSEKWLQSTGQQIPSLDGTGQSMMDAGDLIGLPMLAKTLSKIAFKKLKDTTQDLVLKETLQGSPTKLPRPSRLVKEETDLPFFTNDDNLGELMNLGSEKGGRFFNKQKPLSVSEWLEHNDNLRNLWGDTGPIGGLPRPTSMVRRYLPLPTEPGLNVPAHIREALIKRRQDAYFGMDGRFSTDDFSKLVNLQHRLDNNVQLNAARQSINDGSYAARLNDNPGLTVRNYLKTADDVREYSGDWNEGFRIVDSPTQTRLPYFSKVADDINKGLTERLAGKEMQLKVEPTNYGYKTQIKGKVGDLEFPDWREAGTMGLNPTSEALQKGQMLLKPVTDAQQGVDAVFANSSFPFSSLPNTEALMGKGYGKELYRQLNASFKKEYGTRLNSGHNSLSEHSRALWNSLVDKGDAWRIGDPQSTVKYGLYGGLLGTILGNQKDK